MRGEAAANEPTDADVSSDELPEGWIKARLEQVLTPGGLFDGPFGSNLKTSDYVQRGVRVIRLENLGYLRFNEEKRTFISPQKYESLKKHRVDEGDIIFGSFVDGSTRVCVLPALDTLAIAKADCFCIRPRTDITDRVFLASLLATSAVHHALFEEIHGATRPRINTRQLSQLEISLPPLTEQQRIVSKITELLKHINACREHLAKVPKILKAFRQSVLAAACSGRLTEDWRETQGKHLDDWDQIILVDAAEMRLGKMLDQAKNVGTPTPYVRNVNVRWFSFDLTDLLEMRATKEDRIEFNIRDGDLLICEGGEPGRCAVWDLGPTDLIFQKAIHRVRPNSNTSPHWLAFNLKNHAESGALEEFFTGSGIKHLTGRSLARYTFPLPTLDEQHEIVRRVETLFKLAEKIGKRVEAGRERADKITQSILAKAFRGELVPTEAELARREGRDYEPACARLERIKAEREKQSAPTTGRAAEVSDG